MGAVAMAKRGKPDHDTDKQQQGIECPKCGCRHFYTTHTIRTANHVKRRKECRHCGRIVFTNERTLTDEAERKKKAQE